MNFVQNFPRIIVQYAIEWPRQVTAHFPWAGALVARFVVGYVFMLTGWNKLTNLPVVIENFAGWGIPFPGILAPFVSAVECFGGALLLVGLFTRVSAAMLCGVMVVAVLSAKWSDVDSLETLLGFEETLYFALFFWLAVAGAGRVSVDHRISKE